MRQRHPRKRGDTQVPGRMRPAESRAPASGAFLDAGQARFRSVQIRQANTATVALVVEGQDAQSTGNLLEMYDRLGLLRMVVEVLNGTLSMIAIPVQVKSDSADTQPVIRMNVGTLELGAGGTSGTDISLGRDSANVLNLAAGDSFKIHTGYVDMGEIAAPGTPAANRLRIYVKDKAGTSALYFIDDAGTEFDLTDAGGAGAPDDASYLVGAAHAGLSAEIVVGTSPGGELGGTWASPTVDATHSGSTHSAAADTHIADASDAHDASAISIADAGLDFTATDVEGALDELQADNEAHVAAADPHTGYQRESEKGAASGYASLGADTLVPQDQLGTGVQDGTKFLRDDGTWQPPGASSTNIKQTEIDFGTTPVAEASFLITDVDVSAGSQLIGSVAYEAPTGKDLDELEMDGLDLKFAPGTGDFTLYVRGMDGYVADKFKINYLIG